MIRPTAQPLAPVWSRPLGSPAAATPAEDIPQDAVTLGSIPGPEKAPTAAVAPGPWPSRQFVIFGRRGQQPPAEISDVICQPTISPAPFPSERWVVTPRIEASHRHQVETYPAEQLRDRSDSELVTVISPLLERRYGERQGLTIAELGPATSTSVARTLSDSSHRYVAVEMSEPYLEKQLEFLVSDTHSRCFGVQGDTYNLPLRPGQTDLVVVSCHPPFISSNLPDRLEAFGEVHQALKPGGELVLFPFDATKQPAEVMSYLEKHFEVVDQAPSPLAEGRVAVVFRKRAPEN